MVRLTIFPLNDHRTKSPNTSSVACTSVKSYVPCTRHGDKFILLHREIMTFRTTRLFLSQNSVILAVETIKTGTCSHCTIINLMILFSF